MFEPSRLRDGPQPLTPQPSPGTDEWSIHKGSCGYGYIWKDEPLGWDVAAASDFMEGYEEVRTCARARTHAAACPAL